MKFFCKTTIMLCIYISFSFQQQVIGAPQQEFMDVPQKAVIDAPNEDDASNKEKIVPNKLSRGVYVKGTVFNRLISWNEIEFQESTTVNNVPHKRSGSEERTFHSSSQKINLGYFFSFSKNHKLVTDISYYHTSTAEDKSKSYSRTITAERQEGNTKVKVDKSSFKRRETTMSIQYKGIYEFSEEFWVLFGTYLSIWKFKNNKNNSGVLLSSILNPTNNQTAPVQFSPYFGIVLRPWSSGEVTTKTGWNHYLFQSESIESETIQGFLRGHDLHTKQQSVKIKGGHSVFLKFEYKHDFRFLKVAISTQYTQVIISRSAKYENFLADIVDIKWNNLAFSGKISYNINENLSIKARGSTDAGFLEYLEYGYGPNFSTRAVHTSLSGGVGLVYNF